MKRRLGLPFLVAFAMSVLSAALVSAQSARSNDAAAALLALEEAELRERMVTGLAIAEGLRLRGRTVLVAITEIDRVHAALTDLDPTDPERTRLARRLETLEHRRVEVSAGLDLEFRAYIEVVSEISSGLWPRLRRVGGELEDELRSRNLSRLGELMPLLRAHVEEFNRDGALSAEASQRWRREIDDSFALREERLRRRLDPERPVVDGDAETDQDI